MITVVSGLPRSGTSLMMQMLKGGGIPLFCDGVRGADADNPRGYYECEKVKTLKQDKAWVKEADGCALKVISILLPELPPDEAYRIIFMTRNLDEILASQQKMLEHRGVIEVGVDDAAMKQHYEKHLLKSVNWLRLAETIDVFYCDYNRLLADPMGMVDEMIACFDMKLDVARMVSIVDKSLYHQRG